MVMDAVESRLNSCTEEKLTLAALFAKSASLAQADATQNGYVTERAVNAVGCRNPR